MSVTEPTMVAFELEQLQLDAGRLTVAGRWSGVRGRRFVRPSLSLVGADRSARVLAELEHKPWAADSGETWVASFPWSGSAPAGADFELSVAPDICIRLPSPHGGAEGELVLKAFRPADAPDGGAPRRSSPRAPTETASPPVRKSRARSEPATPPDDETALRARQAEARQAELARQWKRAVEHRDQALSERDEARGERDQFSAALASATAARDRATQERDRALAERDGALSERDGALAERDGALSERDRALAERDVVAGELRAPLPEQPTTPLLTRSDTRVGSPWTARMLALTAIAVVVLVLLLTIAAK